MKFSLKFFLLILLSLGLYACGGGESESSTTDSTASDSSQPAVAPVAELSIEGNDQMRYNKDRLEVFAGQTVKLTLKHAGQMAVESMGHNWVLLKPGTDVAEFGQASATAKETDYIPASMADQVIVHTKMLGGGEEVTIEFEAPAAGTYDFMCSFPGHYAFMKGKFVVSEP